MTTLLVLTLVTAVAAAVRSTWSPCGLSMLSTITPLAERSRGHRYGTTVTWFVAGGVVGGLLSGLVAAVLAFGLGVLELSPSAALGAAGAVALLGAATDAGVFGSVIPVHKRQVNDRWLSRYRPWVYSGGFGFQIGTGFLTYIMTAAVFVTFVSAALTRSPAAAIGVGLLFGTVRGSAILLGSRITTPAKLGAFHAVFDAWREPVRRGVAVVQLLVAVVAGGTVWGLPGAIGTALVAGLVGVLALRPPAGRSSVDVTAVGV